MPHLILECSQTLAHQVDFSVFFKQAYQLLAESLPTKITSCKGRVIFCDKSYIGNDFINNAFIHLTLKILPGRSDVIKAKITNQLLLNLKHIVNSLNIKQVSLSVELVDLSAHYTKL
jgi:5-carboxymethyl-2-hydroxymuconate isomerase